MKLRTLILALGLAAIAQGTTGCYVEWDDRGRTVPAPVPPDLIEPDVESASFTFSRSRGCAVVLNRTACGSDRPLMAGVNEAIRVTVPGVVRGATPSFRSSDPEVLAVQGVVRTSGVGERFEGLVQVRGLRTGAAALQATGADGRAWRFMVRVDEAAGMILEAGEGATDFDPVEGRLRLRVGERASLAAQPVNLNVERLYASDGVTWTAPDDDTVRLSRGEVSGARVASDEVRVEGRAAGTVTLQVRAGVVERAVVVEVTE